MEGDESPKCPGQQETDQLRNIGTPGTSEKIAIKAGKLTLTMTLTMPSHGLSVIFIPAVR